ncbi:TPA: hypothetical protein DCL22_03745 [Candidatus Moranbacteria bacterium]|nr:hypothetical protein [Candidatus Moranbacteria bacterium]
MHMLWMHQRVEIRDVQKGEEPFVYSTLNRGPGYVDVKGSVGIRPLFELEIELLTDRIIADGLDDIELVVGMMTGGALPGFHLAYFLSERFGRTVHYLYQRGARKEGGHGELDTGDRNNSLIKTGCKTLVVEELVNFAGTTTNGVLYEREEKNRVVTDAACILFYENPVAIKRLAEHNIKLHHVVGLPELLDFGVAKGYADENLVEQYREFLRDPKVWNESRGFEFHE